MLCPLVCEVSLTHTLKHEQGHEQIFVLLSLNCSHGLLNARIDSVFIFISPTTRQTKAMSTAAPTRNSVSVFLSYYDDEKYDIVILCRSCPFTMGCEENV